MGAEGVGTDRGALNYFSSLGLAGEDFFGFFFASDVFVLA
jgi:hypothetical protein